ncbi:hypothetical protein [Pseudomonas mosselii]|uniref:hypothetical protein n=1 Tax=Pseudomonas mosselii TaxID=78327 RepID=UPI001647E8F6|nr:hypothetical protein [Pseudomonas mosselii]MBC3456330.1 hypothetical protein [Pseudomonas mosselii]
MPLDTRATMQHYFFILSFLCVFRNDDRALACGYVTHGWLLMVVGLLVLFVMWFLQALTDSPKAVQQLGQEGERRMGKAIIKASVNLAANASTAYYVNNLPAVTIGAD